MTNFTIQIISDTICPWCYIGHRRLSRAITTHKATHPTDTFAISWHAFYLNAAAPTYPGTDKQAAYHAKFGAERVALLQERLAAAGKEDGVAFRFGGQTGNTRDSHRVIWYAGEQEREGKGGGEGLQTRVVEELFRKYFEEEGNITDQGVLVDAAVRAGLAREEMVRVLESGEGGKEVDQEAERARRRTVTGVPFFTIQNHYSIGGAEEPDAFLEVFNEVKEREN